MGAQAEGNSQRSAANGGEASARRRPRRRAGQPDTRGKSRSEPVTEPIAERQTGPERTSAAVPASRSRSQRPSATRGDTDRQWRELAGSGRSQLSLGAALRGRDADRPTAEDVAEAERNTAVQRRNWVPTNSN